MRPATILLFLVLAGISLIPTESAEAKKKGFKLDVEKKTAAETEEEEMSRGSFMVASQCTECNNGYTLGQIKFSGYDKPRNSGSETFFITNLTDRTLSGITLYIDYRTTDGRQLNKRFIRLSCVIPAGETRIAEVKSWDKQKSFYYEKSSPGKSGGSAYTVIFDPVAYYLRF